MGDSFYLYYPSTLQNRDGGNIGLLTSRWTRGPCGAHPGDILRTRGPAVIVVSFVDLCNHVQLPFSNVDLKIPMCSRRERPEEVVRRVGANESGGPGSPDADLGMNPASDEPSRNLECGSPHSWAHTKSRRLKWPGELSKERSGSQSLTEKPTVGRKSMTGRDNRDRRQPAMRKWIPSSKDQHARILPLNIKIIGQRSFVAPLL